mmetsp:Transcript_21946/g.36750  ORF Transcript_21946/g.36750 Transcript_21946/m.36750 type:complete len:377 (+) Transcript_21946:48-1178(+)
MKCVPRIAICLILVLVEVYVHTFTTSSLAVNGQAVATNQPLDTSRNYRFCPLKQGAEERILYVATCDTRSGWKGFMALRNWNVTSEVLRINHGINMTNVCSGQNWGKYGFLTKPLIYLDYINQLKTLPNSHLVHIILMDSDTFFSVMHPQKIWNKYDCARGGKDVVLSTEMSCWVGRYCDKTDLDRWYNNSQATPSYSPFANSGVVMGSLAGVGKMLEFVVKNNQSYFTTYKKLKFDDQYAIADYGISVNPAEVSLDYHQQISASASIHAPGDPPDTGWPFVCLNHSGQFDMSCHIWNNLLRRQGHFRTNLKTCLVERYTHEKMALHQEMMSLAPDPLIWHGNGAGKQIFGAYGHQSFKCFLHKKNMTEQDYYNTF